MHMTRKIKIVSSLIVFLVVIFTGYRLYILEFTGCGGSLLIPAYTIEGKRMFLDSVSYDKENRSVNYFGKEVRGDFDNDNTEDAAFIVTTNPNEGRVLYYLVAKIDKGTRCELIDGTNGVLLGDRIIPQSTEWEESWWKRGTIIVKYLDRKPGEPMSAIPSVNVTKTFRMQDNMLVSAE